MMYRDVKNGPLKKLVVHNVTSDTGTNICDASMVHDMIMVDHHLSSRSNVGEGLIAKQRGGGTLRLYQAGDQTTM